MKISPKCVLKIFGVSHVDSEWAIFYFDKIGINVDLINNASYDKCNPYLYKCETIFRYPKYPKIHVTEIKFQIMKFKRMYPPSQTPA